jgi:hypothetical protein
VRNWNVLALAAAAVVAGFLWMRLDTAQQRAENAELREQVLREAHIEALDAWDQFQADNRRASEALEAAMAAAATRAVTIARLKEEIARARPDEDGPLAPVLRHALDGLRAELSAAGDGAEAGLPGDPGAAVRCADMPLPPPPGATQRDAAAWAADAVAAWADCRDKIDALRALTKEWPT